MAKDSTGQDDRVSPQKAPRKPLTIDLPAAEVARKSGEGAATASASSAAAASSAGAAGPPKAGETQKAAEKESASAGARPAQGSADTIIPSAFATKSEPGSPTKPVDPVIASQPPSAKSGTSFVPLLLAALLGGAVAAIVIIAADVAGYLHPADEPAAQVDLSPEISGLRSEVAALKETTDDLTPLREQIGAVENSIAELASRPPAESGGNGAALKELQDRLAALESAKPSGSTAPNVEPRLAQLSQEIAALKSAAPPDMTPLESALASLRQEVDAVSAKADAAPGEARVAALDKGIADLQAKLDETSRKIDSATAWAPAVAANALAGALDAGRPFQAELAAVKSLGIDASAVDALAPHAAAGLPTLVALRTEFEQAMDEVALAAPIPETTGTIDRLMESAKSLVEVRPANPIAGSDPGAIVARVRGALAAGDLKTALAEWNTLPDTIKAPTAEWAKKGEARSAADDLVAELRTTALAKVGGGG